MKSLIRLAPALLVATALAGCKGEMTEPQISISALVSSITVDGEPANVTLERGTLPPENAAPAITADMPVATINGGSFPIDITSAEPFSEVLVTLPSMPDYFRVLLDAPVTTLSLVVTLDPGARAGALNMLVAGATGPTQVGPYVSNTISVTRVGSGDVQVSVAWNSAADVDLHVVDPFGEEVYWGSRTVESGGELDLDSNAACGTDQPRNENIVWPANEAPSGTYIVRLDYWDSCGAGSTDYVLTVLVKGQEPQVFSGTFTGGGDSGGLGSGIFITEFTK